MTNRIFDSPYMHWAKTKSRARFNLATSGVPGLKLADLGITTADLEINGPGGYGYTPLREAISNEYQVPVDSIVAGGGTSGANEYAFLLLLGPGDHAIIESPAYDILPRLAQFTGATITRFHRRPDNQWAIDTDEVARLMTPQTRLIILTNLHNPSGQLTDQKTLKKLSEIAATNNAYVLVDEVYLDCVWEDRQPSAFHAGPNFIVTSSLTKVYGLSGLRCGWIFAPPGIAERLWRLIDLFDNIPSHASELMSVIAFQQLDAIRQKSKVLIETSRSIYKAFATRHGFEIPKYGTVAFPRIPASNDQLCDLLREKYETTVVPGHFFEMPDRIRISLVTDPQTLTQGLQNIDAALAEL